MPSDRIRLTVSISPQAHEAFSRMADAAGISLGRAIGGWLDDTLEGAQFVAAKMQEARTAPQRALDDLKALGGHLATGDADTVLEAIQREAAAARKGPPPRGVESSRASAGESSPSSNTGIKSPRSAPTQARNRVSKGSK